MSVFSWIRARLEARRIRRDFARQLIDLAPTVEMGRIDPAFVVEFVKTVFGIKGLIATDWTRLRDVACLAGENERNAEWRVPQAILNLYGVSAIRLDDFLFFVLKDVQFRRMPRGPL